MIARGLIARGLIARGLIARGLIAPGGPQRLPTRAAPQTRGGRYASRAGPLRGLRGRSAADLTGPAMTMQPMRTSATQRAATITPGVLARDQPDHDHRNR